MLGNDSFRDAKPERSVSGIKNKWDKRLESSKEAKSSVKRPPFLKKPSLLSYRKINTEIYAVYKVIYQATRTIKLHSNDIENIKNPNFIFEHGK